ncbi:response regulator [Varunaivibrio sulfuroxidans]|uniref:Response regulator receiver domain-containing protein n=1 Tax=Varunaivibrio sulfuroxidans TaxID=1773489 RepID=A0A4R3JE43_9PROT|nr:response regulator [Varunaivibrio sulfuroxidans]TCS64037.1 response regulator receiver domain-containing protein [Varunaivibrio sulfuroxidans]WES31512.1 response regulator [Varunaivibrio sulfuroxidans]
MPPPLKKILYVEDDLDIQIVARMALQTVGGFTLEVCSSGREAVEIAPMFVPDLVLLDVMMPQMDGPSTLRALRELSVTKTTPTIFMTAKVMPSDVARYREIGAVDVIAKPFDPMNLSLEIQNIWKRHHDGG